MTNPSPGRITPQLWRLWTELRPVLPGGKLGGIYAAKPGYHSSRQENQSKWPSNYSIQLALDKQGPGDKAAAIDLTLSDAEMRKRTRYLADAAARNDPRLAAVREFYGTLDSRTVFGRIKDSRTGLWRASTADSSHLWHIHISFFRAFVSNWDELAPLVSVLAGEPQWKGMGMQLPRKGDKGDHVQVIQRMLVAVGCDTAPGKDDKARYDGVYGPATEKAVNAFRARYDVEPATRVTAWTYYRLVRDVGCLDAAKAAERAAEQWLAKNSDRVRGWRAETLTVPVVAADV